MASKPKRLTHEARRERREVMASMVERGNTYAQVAAIYGVSEQTVRVACKATPKKRGAK